MLYFSFCVLKLLYLKFFGCSAWHAGSQFSPTHATIEPVSLSWKAEVSTTGPPGVPSVIFLFNSSHLENAGTHVCGHGSLQLGTCQLPSSCISRSGAGDQSTRGGGTRPLTPGQSEPGILMATLVCATGGHINQLLLSKSGPKDSFLLIWDLTRHGPRLSMGGKPSAMEAATCGQVRALPTSRGKQGWDGPNARQVPGPCSQLQPPGLQLVWTS